jgi:hypothetical protein
MPLPNRCPACVRGAASWRFGEMNSAGQRITVICNHCGQVFPFDSATSSITELRIDFADTSNEPPATFKRS